MGREAYARLLSGFVASLHDHIRKEEAGFLPAAERSLDAVDWAELESETPSVVDPLALDPVERRFAVLRRNLEAWDTANRFLAR